MKIVNLVGAEADHAESYSITEGQRIGDGAVLASILCDAPMGFVFYQGAPGGGSYLELTAVMQRDWPDCVGNTAFRAKIAVRSFTVVTDVSADGAWRGDDTLRAAPAMRLFAAAPLVGPQGEVVGSVGVFDTSARSLTKQESAGLQLLAARLGRELELVHLNEQQRKRIAAVEHSHEALTARERLLDGVLAHADVLVYAKDLDERFLYANAALERIVGVSGGLAGRLNHEVFPAVWAEEYRRNDIKITSTGDREIFDEEVMDPNGFIRQLRSTKYPLLDEQGQIYGIAGVSTDVTELAAARADLAESEQRWRSLLENSAVGVGLIGEDGTVNYVNPAGSLLCGARPGDRIEGRPATDFLPAEIRRSAAAMFQRVVRSGSPVVSGRWRIQRLDGSSITVELSAMHITLQGHRAVQVQMRDVTAQLAAQDALHASERRFRAVFENSPVAMALSDQQGRWIDINRAFCELYDRGPEQLIGATATDFCHPDDRVLIAGSEAGQLASPDGIHRFEARFLTPDGRVRWSWISITAISGPDGQPWTLAVIGDITDRRAAEDSLRASEAELTAIADVVRCVQSGTDPRPLVVRSIQKLSGAAAVSLIEAPDDHTLITTASVGAEVHPARSIPLSDTSVTAAVWHSGKPVFIGDVSRNPTVHPVLAGLGTVSALWQPVIVSGKVRAVLLATWTHQITDPSDSAARAVRILADEAASSLDAARLRGELERLAMTDPLTGSLNRRAWDMNLQRSIIEAKEGNAPLTLALVDLDRFKLYNDTHGHSSGDVLLRDFASAARACLRKKDIFARWGGEEFIVALPDVDMEAARQILDRVRRSVPDNQTCSIGYAMWDHNESIGACINRADAALYDAKRSGRDQLAFQ